jgi:cellobiose phosphorylase
MALLWPPYDGGDERVRGTSTFVPGAKENGGIFCHANTWSIIAAAMLGWGDDAYQYYRQILPLAPGRTRICTRSSRTRIRRTSAGRRIRPSAWAATPG